MTLDTNVVASGLRRSGSAAAEIIRHWRGDDFALVTSAHILDELARAFAKPYFVSNESDVRAKALVQLVETNATVVELSVEVAGVATHPVDDKVLATALGRLVSPPETAADVESWRRASSRGVLKRQRIKAQEVVRRTSHGPRDRRDDDVT